MKVTIADVAREAGVSTATVSYVLNRAKNVSPTTRERVLGAVRRLGYHPNNTARSLKTGKKNMIGFVVPDISNIYFATLIQSIESAIAPSGYNLLIANTQESVEREMNIIKTFSSNMVDGMIISSSATDFEEIRGCIPASLPVIFIDRTPAHCDRESIVITSYSAVSAAVEDLLDQGHRRIGYIAGLAHLSTTADRLNAYVDTMKRRGVPCGEDLIAFANSMHNGAIAEAETLVQRGCTALVVSNQVMTEDVLSLCINKKITLDQDLALVGFRDSPLSTALLNSIPVVEQPSWEMGAYAGSEIVKRIQDGDKASRCSKIFVSSYSPHARLAV
ncbi:MAG TPA: LacI family transcriptional regulator [Candidatus Fournierella merdigallinarum]|nr:LacI family transcriptional regulator [Candidatus Fournierella merdigallinarum]